MGPAAGWPCFLAKDEKQKHREIKRTFFKSRVDPVDLQLGIQLKSLSDTMTNDLQPLMASHLKRWRGEVYSRRGRHFRANAYAELVCK